MLVSVFEHGVMSTVDAVAVGTVGGVGVVGLSRCTLLSALAVSVLEHGVLLMFELWGSLCLFCSSLALHRTVGVGNQTNGSNQKWSVGNYEIRVNPCIYFGPEDCERNASLA